MNTDGSPSPGAPAEDVAVLAARVRLARRTVVVAGIGAVAAPVLTAWQSAAANNAARDTLGDATEAAATASRTAVAKAQVLHRTGVTGTGTPGRGRLSLALHEAMAGQEHAVGVCVLDRRTGLKWHYRGDALVATGSVVKVLIVAAALKKARAAGSSLTDRQKDWATRAITESNNTAASSLYAWVEGHTGVAALAKALGMAATAAAPKPSEWGATLTNPLELVTMMHAVTQGSPATHRDDDAYLLDLMARVTPAQRWGVGAAASASVTTRLKNGWMTFNSADWVVNSVGDVMGEGRDYILAIMQDHQESSKPAMGQADRVGRAVFQSLAQPLT